MGILRYCECCSKYLTFQLSVSAYFDMTEDTPETKGGAHRRQEGAAETVVIDVDAVPDASGVRQLCGEFVTITQTNSDLAMTYLTGSNWNLQVTMVAYFRTFYGVFMRLRLAVFEKKINVF